MYKENIIIRDLKGEVFHLDAIKYSAIGIEK
jgi:hypothetical protein